MKTVMFLLILFSNLAFFGFWIFKMMIEVRIVLLKKFSTVYLRLFLCGNVKKLKALVDQMEEDEVNEILREDFYNVLSEIEALYKNGRMVLDDKVLEKISNYLHPNTILGLIG